MDPECAKNELFLDLLGGFIANVKQALNKSKLKASAKLKARVEPFSCSECEKRFVKQLN